MKTLVAVAILAMVIVPPALAKAKRAQSAGPQLPDRKEMIFDLDEHTQVEIIEATKHWQ